MPAYPLCHAASAFFAIAFFFCRAIACAPTRSPFIRQCLYAHLILLACSLPFILLLGKLLFGSWHGFWEAVRYALMPDIFSMLRGEWLEDAWATLKLLVFLAVCAAGLFFAHRFFFAQQAPDHDRPRNITIAPAPAPAPAIAVAHDARKAFSWQAPHKQSRQLCADRLCTHQLRASGSAPAIAQ